MNLYDVHVHAVVRVKVAKVEAESQEAAISKAIKAVNFYELFRQAPDKFDPRCDWTETEFAEEFTHYVVDEANDPDYGRSQFWIDRDHLKQAEEDLEKGRWYPMYPSTPEKGS